MKPLLLDHTRYNLWANEKTISSILEAGDSMADQIQTSSFPTIRKTLYHLWDAQVIWFSRLQGISMNAWPSQNFKGNLQEAGNQLIENSKAFVRFIEEIDSNTAENEVKYHAIDGSSYTSSVQEIILHVVNHGTYHRGQIVTMLRTAGFTNVGSTDLIRYYRTR